MAVACYIEAEEEIEDLDMSVDGKAIARADPDKLDAIFKKLKVKPLMEMKNGSLLQKVFIRLMRCWHICVNTRENLSGSKI
ncbi:hypothetical protein C2W62_25575 [Candidatus Entotheonella serta]|nr:hypothetical protein C2W62_25575 [Candidatus Entotheonella serta]